MRVCEMTVTPEAPNYVVILGSKAVGQTLLCAKVM